MEPKTLTEFERDLAPPSLSPAIKALGLWYCHRCTMMILPAGSKGKEAADGERYCTACTPVVVEVPPGMTATGVTLAFVEPTYKAGAAKEAARNRNRPHGTSVADKVRDPRSGPAKNNNAKFVWIGGGSAVALIFGFLIFHTDGSSNKLAVARSTPIEQPIALKSAVPVTDGAALALEKNGSDKSGSEKSAALKKVSDGAPKPGAADEKSLRAEAQARAGGLFASLQNGATNLGSPAPAAAAANPSAKALSESTEERARAAASAQSMDDFETRFKTVQPLIDAEKYSDAENLLTAISKAFSAEPWWTKNADRVTKAQETVQQKNSELEQRARDAAALAQAAAKKEQLDSFENDWKGKLAIGGSTAKAAQQVLDAVRASRERLGKTESDARSNILAETFEKLEKRSQPKLAKADLECALKSLNELKAQLMADPALAAKFSDRWAALHFDLNVSRGAEQALLHVEPSGSGPTDLNYDFKNAEQVAAWSFEGDGENSGSIGYDSASKLLVLKAVGEHNLDPRNGKRVPMATLPFYLNTGVAWAFEAEAGAMKVHARKKEDQLPCFGILVSDGGTNVIRFCVKETRNNELTVYGRGAGDEKEITARLSGKMEDKIRFRMACSSGRIFMSAMSNTKSADLGRMPIGFDPKFVGLYIETHDKEENASIAFDNVKISGMLDKTKISAAISVRRADAVNAVKIELGKTCKPGQTQPAPQLPPILNPPVLKK